VQWMFGGSVATSDACRISCLSSIFLYVLQMSLALI
jgi:hypothetical protein